MKNMNLHTQSKGASATVKSDRNETCNNLGGDTRQPSQVETFAGKVRLQLASTSKHTRSKAPVTGLGRVKTGYEPVDDSRRVTHPFTFGSGRNVSSAGFPNPHLLGVRPDRFNFLSRWPLAVQSATRARWVSCPTIRCTNEPGLHNRGSRDETDLTRVPSGTRFSRQPERRRTRSQLDHPPGRFRQRKDRLNPVRAVSIAARSVVNAAIQQGSL